MKEKRPKERYINQFESLDYQGWKEGLKGAVWGAHRGMWMGLGPRYQDSEWSHILQEQYQKLENGNAFETLTGNYFPQPKLSV